VALLTGNDLNLDQVTRLSMTMLFGSEHLATATQMSTESSMSYR